MLVQYIKKCYIQLDINIYLKELLRDNLFSTIILIFIISLEACSLHEAPMYYEGSFQSVIEIARAKNKPIWMILGGGKNCKSCEQLLEDMRKEGIFRKFQSDYIFFRCNVNEPYNIFLKYIFLMETIPNSYIASPNGEIYSYFSGQLKARHIEQMLTYARDSSPLYPPEHKYFKSNTKKLLNLQNLLVTGYLEYKAAAGDTEKLKRILPIIEKSITLEPYFYNLYFAHKICKELNDTIKTKLYSKQALLTCPDGFQTIIYTPLISELQCQQFIKDCFQSGPRITFEQKQLIIQDKETHQFIFHFKNTGDQPLIIKYVSSSCGCAKPDWDNQPILPEGQGKIRITYHPHKDKSFTKTFWVQSNAINKIEQLILKGQD